MPKVSKKTPLGRGLSSLLGENLNVDNLTNTESKNNLSIVPIDYLSAGSWHILTPPIPPLHHASERQTYPCHRVHHRNWKVHCTTIRSGGSSGDDSRA